VTEERTWEDPEQMIGVDEALERVLSFFQPLSVIDVPLLDALGLVLARDIIAECNVPPFQNSAMDGYAVRAADTLGAPVRLRVVGVAPAGRVPPCDVQIGEALRIMTGAPMPNGADTVVRFEETDEAGVTSRDSLPGNVLVTRAAQAGENVRAAGEDIREGDRVLQAGVRLGPPEIGVLASVNRSTVPVHRRPRVAILSTGDEVIDLGPALQPGQIRNSNSYTVASLVREAGGEPSLLGVARDVVGDLRDKLRQIEPPDLYVTSGGVSLGDYDMVKDVLRAEGEIDIWQVRMKPGKPLAFGRIGDTPLLGLPGNPAAAWVSFLQFGRPAILRMLGLENVCLPEVDATLTERQKNAGRRRHYVRGVLSRAANGFEVRSTGDQGAALLTAAVRANCLIVIPETSTVVEPGSTVRVQVLGTLPT
jgi:molybdopterin molybdotransferase